MISGIGRRKRGAGSRAFTLLELLLTISLLVVIMSLALPALRKPFANQRLRQSADYIRAQWCGARVDAMDSGRVHVFRYTLDGNEFSIQAQADVFGPEAVDSDVDSADALGVSVKQPALPEGITFAAGETAPESRAAVVDAGADPSIAWQTHWSDPIFFYPDGTTSTAVLRLQNKHGRTIDLALRGLTGVVTVSEIGRADEE